MSDILSNLSAQYPTLPEAVILKTALLSLGVRFDPLLAEAAKTALPDFRPHILPDGTSVQIPYLMILENGSLVRLRCREESPFSLTRDQDDAYCLLDHDERIVSFTFAGRPAWHGRVSEDGTPLNGCGLNQHGDMMVLNLTPACEYWSTPQDGLGMNGNSHAGSCRCAFCGYGLPDDRSRSMGQAKGQPRIPLSVMKRACEAVVLGAKAGARHLYLTGGSMTDPELEAQRYLGLIQGVRKASEGVYLAVGSQALPQQHLPAIKEAGADGACFNLEIWDREVWRRVCPGKAKFLGRKMWEESLVEAVQVFGTGNVFSALVIGAEMALDKALADPEASLRSNLEGAHWLLSHGIHPIMSLFWPFAGTDLEKASGPDLHFLLRLYAAVNEMRTELNMPFPETLACKRCLYMQVEGDFTP